MHINLDLFRVSLLVVFELFLHLIHIQMIFMKIRIIICLKIVRQVSYVTDGNFATHPRNKIIFIYLLPHLFSQFIQNVLIYS
jgi:hypothetical protein